MKLEVCNVENAKVKILKVILRAGGSGVHYARTPKRRRDLEGPRAVACAKQGSSLGLLVVFWDTNEVSKMLRKITDC